MIKDSVRVTGALTVTLTDSDGLVKQSLNVDNLVVTTGKEAIAGLLGADSTLPMSHMAIGDSVVEAIAGHTALLSELGRVALTSSIVSGTSVQYTATFGPAIGTGAITEAGIFNDVTAGVMLCRTTFPVVNKSELDTITIVWTVTIN